MVELNYNNNNNKDNKRHIHCTYETTPGQMGANNSRARTAQPRASSPCPGCLLPASQPASHLDAINILHIVLHRWAPCFGDSPPPTTTATTGCCYPRTVKLIWADRSKCHMERGKEAMIFSATVLLKSLTRRTQPNLAPFGILTHCQILLLSLFAQNIIKISKQ